jgi:crossover junction endodeoxyribonuclease RuvC
MAITGNGMKVRTSSKMLQQLLGLKELPKKPDSTDGLAAVCHFFTLEMETKSYTVGCLKTERREKEVT